MIEVHQALFGDDSGAYSLLTSSFSDSAVPLRFANSTDLIDRPPDGVLAEPVIRGFWKEKCFMLIKSFPDTSSGVRKGRVFSHALIIQEKDLLRIQDITGLFKYHLGFIDKSLNLEPIHFKNTGKYNEILKDDKRIFYAINSLIEHNENYNTIAWVGTNGYQNWISRIWAFIPQDIKKSIRIGAAFDPQRVDKNLLNLIYIPDSIKPNWANNNFKIVDLSDADSLRTQTGHYLAGHSDKSRELSELLSNFSIIPKDIDDISQFEKMIPTYKALDNGASLKKLIIFADLVSKYTAKTQSSLPSKQKLFNSILRNLHEASGVEINMLTSPDWTGFKDAEKKISESLDSWLNKNVFEEKNNKDIPTLINKAFSETENPWWSDPIKKHILTGLKKWKKNYAKIFWKWITVEPELLEKLGSILPISAQNDIVLTTPRFKKEIEEKVLQFANNRRWIFLHGMLVVRNHSINDAIMKQLSIDNDPKEFGALRIMSEKISSEIFLLSSLNFDDDRLYVLSAQILGRNPKLLSKHIVLENSRWHKLWLEFTCQGNEVWEGFSHPNIILNKIFDYIINGGVFNDDLLKTISSSTSNDLSSHPRRKDIWSILSGVTKINFLKKAAQSCLILISTKSLSLIELELPLRQEIQKDETISGFFKNHSIKTVSKIELLKLFQNIDQKHVIFLIDSNSFSNSESIVLGETIKNKQWKSAASHIGDIVLTRLDLKLAIQQCQELLNVFQRLGLSFFGVLKNSISLDEWWDLFENQAIKLYPKGADQNGLWNYAGGHDSDLLLKGTGKEIWNHAVRIMRNGGNPKVSLLTDKMLEEFPHDEILKKLRKMI
jgi:hypothetical protein